MRATERLERYLREHGQTPAEFAEAVKAHRSQIYRLLTGERGPGIDLAAEIERVTSGAVPARDWAASTKRRTRAA